MWLDQLNILYTSNRNQRLTGCICFLKRAACAKFLWQRSVLNRYCGALNNPMKSCMLNHNLESQPYFSHVLLHTALDTETDFLTFPLLFLQIYLIKKKCMFLSYVYNAILVYLIYILVEGKIRSVIAKKMFY